MQSLPPEAIFAGFVITWARSAGALGPIDRIDPSLCALARIRLLLE
jgi:hypothetical protein